MVPLTHSDPLGLRLLPVPLPRLLRGWLATVELFRAPGAVAGEPPVVHIVVHIDARSGLGARES